MKQYLDIVKHVLDNGAWKSPVRKNNQGEWESVDGGVRTLACPNVFFSHDMNEGFPLLTTKKMAWKTIKVELEGFIKGITDKQWFQDRNCKIWDEWCNPQELINKLPSPGSIHPDSDIDFNQLKKEVQATVKDLGPIYGYQWRHFGEHYGPNGETIGYTRKGDPIFEVNGVTNGTDQLKNIVETLRQNPHDRRMVCSAWNPNQIHIMALPPCHYAWNVTVIDGKVNLFWAQRSADLMLGVPFNIASYGLLLSLLARDAGLEVGNLSACFVDCHIYENQIIGAEKQKVREPQPLPTLEIEDNSSFETSFNIFNWEYNNAHILNYNPLDKINFGDVAV